MNDKYFFFNTTLVTMNYNFCGVAGIKARGLVARRVVYFNVKGRIASGIILNYNLKKKCFMVKPCEQNKLNKRVF